MKSTVETVIEDLVQATCGDKSVREQFLMREALRNLVRLTRTEYVLEIKSSASRLTRNVTEHAACRKAKIDRMLKTTASSNLLQQRLEFDDERATGMTNRAKVHGARHGS
jgi:hypothetical protein